MAAGAAMALVAGLLVLSVAGPTDLSTEDAGTTSTEPSVQVLPWPSTLTTRPTPPVEEGASSRPGPEQVEPGDYPPLIQGRTFEVASIDQWWQALGAVQPGDGIVLTATIRQPLSYHGSRAGSDQTGADGTATRPITITSNEGVWIDPGNQGNNIGGFDLVGAVHVDLVGIRVRNSQFGIRIHNSTGSESRPLLTAHNVVEDTGHAGLHIAGGPGTESSWVTVRNNQIRRTGRTANRYGEGVYLGYGSEAWVDTTNHVTVTHNDISETGAEGIDIKPGTHDILVESNTIHDLAPIDGGAISALYVGDAPNPDRDTFSNIIIRNNRIWNQNLNGEAGSNDWAIWIGHGGVNVEDNVIWGLRDDPDRARAIRIRALAEFGPHPIRIVDNVFWTATGWSAEGDPSGAGNVQAADNRGPAGAQGIEIEVAAGGDQPTVGLTGPADDGDGPGSLVLAITR